MIRVESVFRRHGFKIILFSLVFILAVYLLYTYVEQRSKASLDDMLNLNGTEEAQDFTLYDLSGDEMSLSDTNGKVRLVYFYFSHCIDVCAPTTHILSRVQEQLKDEGVFGTETAMYSITFDPERDTQERLIEFSGMFDADPAGWHFVRGDVEYTRELAEKYGVMIIEQEDGQFGHSNIIFLVDQEGMLRHYFVDTRAELSPTEIVDKIKILL